MDRSGSFSTKATAPGKPVDVGCWPDSSGPFHRRPSVSAITGREQMQQTTCANARYSMTSSASNWIALGTSMPSALAVCRLMTNSNLLDCATGRSAGLAPLRI
jgi:hypothetical protein